jgi:6-phosphofructokinase
VGHHAAVLGLTCARAKAVRFIAHSENEMHTRIKHV